MRLPLAGPEARSILIWAMLIVLGAAAGAQEGPDVEGWRSDLERAEEYLLKGGERRAERARELCVQTYSGMLEWPGRGETAAGLLGEALRLLAVAEVRVGETDRARWHWAVARNVWPQVSERGLEAFPDAASELGSAPVGAGAEVPGASEEGVSPPVPMGMVPIAYPGQFRKQGIEGTTEVVVVVSEAGVPVRPLLRASCGVPGFDVAVMEAARQWTFSPATRAGRPVAGSYTLRAKFELGS